MQISTELRKKSGIYQLINTETKECYIGAASCLYTRLKSHYNSFMLVLLMLLKELHSIINTKNPIILI